MRRTLPPVHSPVPVRALLRGAHTVVSGSARDRARRAVGRWMDDRFAPTAVLLADSGTSALALAIEAAATDRRRPVALPAYGCFDLATATEAARAPFVFYDLRPDTLGPDPDSLGRALEAGADRVVVVHAYGVPVDLAAITPLIRSAGALLIEDAAQGMGVLVGDRSAGSAGDFGVLSFGRGKGITSGGGGALLANSPEAGRRLADLEPRVAAGGAGLAALLALAAQWALARPRWYAIPSALPFLGLGRTVHHPPHPPAAIARSALGVLAETFPVAEGEERTRRAVAARLHDAMPRDAAAFTPPSGTLPGWLRFPVRVPRGRAEWLASGQALGVQPGYPCALPDLPGFGDRAGGAQVGDGARRLVQELVTLPTHSLLEPADVERLTGWLRGR